MIKKLCVALVLAGVVSSVSGQWSSGNTPKKEDQSYLKQVEQYNRQQQQTDQWNRKQGTNFSNPLVPTYSGPIQDLQKTNSYLQQKQQTDQWNRKQGTNFSNPVVPSVK